VGAWGPAAQCAAESAEDDVGLEVIHGALDEKLDGASRDKFAPAEAETGQLAAFDQLVDEVVGDAEGLGGRRHRQHEGIPARR
jgi:hypothetical protein